MLDITFFTSNQTKLAHATYLAQPYPLRVRGFRERTYHAGYDEPRTSSREELLRCSYESALAQAEKAGIASATHFFMLEDTSVKIEALSGTSGEVPGLDIKYWMRGKDWVAVDALIKAHGGDRRATVRSDIVLHIPKHYRNHWNLAEPYLVFTGYQEGRIVSEEIQFETNAVYPWLDNKTFNKWFQPEGAAGPLGSLAISDADIFDFRRKAFEKLVEFLRKKRLVSWRSQLSLPLEDLPLILVCGYTCAGKTTAGQHLAETYGFAHIEASDFMHLAFYTRHGSTPPMKIGDFAEFALTERPQIAAERISQFLQGLGNVPAVVSGFRSPQEIEWLETASEVSGRRIQVVFIDAPAQVRFDRMKSRGRAGDETSHDKFQAKDGQQRRMGLDAIAERSGTKVLLNVNGMNAFLQSVEALYAGRPIRRQAMSDMLSASQQFTDVRLEDAILIALATHWTGESNRMSFTTSQIAAIVNRHFLHATKKHKDNISRYFNQEYYPYFEMNVGPDGKRTYRLSNTGYGMAAQRLRTLTSSQIDSVLAE